SEFFEQTFLVSDDDGRTIRQRDHAEFHRAHLRRVIGIYGSDPAAGHGTENTGGADAPGRTHQETPPSESGGRTRNFRKVFFLHLWNGNSLLVESISGFASHL